MARYILMDHNSGLILGDTANMNGRDFSHIDDPIEAVRMFDKEVGDEDGQSYELLGRHPADSSFGYNVYRADISGDEALPVVTNGSDAKMIAAVTRDCTYIGFVRCESTD